MKIVTHFTPHCHGKNKKLKRSFDQFLFGLGEALYK